MSGEKQSRLYKELAEQYRDKNINQAWLCYENALYHYQKECVTEVSDIDKETGLRSEQMDPFCRRSEEQQRNESVRKSARFCCGKDSSDIIILQSW